MNTLTQTLFQESTAEDLFYQETHCLWDGTADKSQGENTFKRYGLTNASLQTVKREDVDQECAGTDDGWVDAKM